MHVMSQIRSICVYCGSGPGTNPAFVEAARAFGAILAKNGIRLIYGGGSKGLMGAVAISTLDRGGTVTGVMPDFLVGPELMLERAQERIVTGDMHERKRIMFERADVEQLTWAQIGRHKKPILILNVDHFWDPLCALFDQMKRLEFIRAGLTVNLLVVDRAEDILPKLREAARVVAEPQKEMTPAAAERM